MKGRDDLANKKINDDEELKNSQKAEDSDKDTDTSGQTAEQSDHDNNSSADTSGKGSSDNKTSDDKTEKDSADEKKDSEKSSDKKDDSSDEKKSHFGSHDKKKKKDPKDDMIADLQDRVKRQMAEFENFRKRTEKEKSSMYDMGAIATVEKILPVVDNFERGFSGVDESNDDPFVQGMQMVYKQLTKALDDMGVKEIPAQGETFNPDLHNAVMHVDDDQYGEQEIVAVMQKGYTYNGKVVRHAMVQVAN